LKKIVQEIVLSELSRGEFFEDLDFALTIPNSNFDLSKYFSYVENELKAYGLNLEISTKEKKIDSNIKR
jgi:hypothetical protein